MADWREDRIGSALRGDNPTVLARMPAGFAVIGDVQWLPGYCVLLADDPSVTRLSDLPRSARLEFLDSMERLGDAVEQIDVAFGRARLRRRFGPKGFDLLRGFVGRLSLVDPGVDLRPHGGVVGDLPGGFEVDLGLRIAGSMGGERHARERDAYSCGEHRQSTAIDH
jgi:hypothetical protein